MTADPGAVGLIGLGEIGQVHAAAVRRSGAARLVAVADTAPELLPPFEAQGVRGYRDAGELITDPEVGTVCVCLPHYLHFPVALEAIRAGKNVLAEKPLTTSLEQGQWLVDGGAIGRPVLIRLRLGLGPRSGALGLIEANHHGPPGTIDDEIEITGSEATLRVAGLESLFYGYRSGPALLMFRDRQWQEVPVQPDDWSESVQASVMAYLDAIVAGREPPVTGAAALESVSLLQRIYDTAAVLPGPADLG